jgi:hypothetical protein
MEPDMTEEDEAFDELAKRQGMWGGGFPAKRAMAADKLQEPVSFPCCGYTDATAIKWNQFNGVVQCHMCGQVYTASPAAQPAQEPVAWLHEWEDGERVPLLSPRDDRNDDQPKTVRPLVYGDTAPPAQEPYDQTALELCNVCGWKTLIPDDGCLNCERAQPAQEPVALVIDGVLVKSALPEKYTGHLYTTPPKREWVVFPTMLRKMWSGGEVQAWLDENVNKEKNNGT